MTDPASTLKDERDVCDALYRFAEGIDLRDWPLYRSAFADRITVDYTSYRAGSQGEMAAEDWVARAKARFSTLDATQHTMTNPRVSLTGDRALCSMYVEAHHVLVQAGGSTECTLGGRYLNELVRLDGRWGISTLTLQVRWVRGDRSILDLPT